MLGNKSSNKRKFQLWNFRCRPRKFSGTKVPVRVALTAESAESVPYLSSFKQTNNRKITASIHRSSHYPNITLSTLDDVFSAHFCLHWCGFFPPPRVLGTVIPPSNAVETDWPNLKHAATAFLPYFADSKPHASTVNLCLTNKITNTAHCNLHYTWLLCTENVCVLPLSGSWSYRAIDWTVSVVGAFLRQARRLGIRCQTVFVTQNWVSILSNVSWRHTFLRNIDDKMYSTH